LAFTLLLSYDYFPNIPLVAVIPKGVLITLILGLSLFSFMFKKYKGTNYKELLKWQIFSIIYTLFLMGIFTFLGGQSSSGFAFDNGLLWIALLISLFEIHSLWKKVKSSEA
jgi:hypothetical protein